MTWVNGFDNFIQALANPKPVDKFAMVDYQSLEVEGIDTRDYPDFCDAYFSSGCYEDGTPLTDDELDQLTILAGDVLWEMAFESLH